MENKYLIYENKYLKYKNKYLNLKKMRGGGWWWWSSIDDIIEQRENEIREKEKKLHELLNLYCKGNGDSSHVKHKIICNNSKEFRKNNFKRILSGLKLINEEDEITVITDDLNETTTSNQISLTDMGNEDNKVTYIYQFARVNNKSPNEEMLTNGFRNVNYMLIFYKEFNTTSENEPIKNLLILITNLCRTRMYVRVNKPINNLLWERIKDQLNMDTSEYDYNGSNGSNLADAASQTGAVALQCDISGLCSSY